MSSSLLNPAILESIPLLLGTELAWGHVSLISVNLPTKNSVQSHGHMGHQGLSQPYTETRNPQLQPPQTLRPRSLTLSLTSRNPYRMPYIAGPNHARGCTYTEQLKSSPR